MRNNTSRYKLYILFILPIFFISYLLYLILYHKYNDLENINTFNSSAKIIKTASLLLHEIQLERGISSGYIVKKEENPYIKKLLWQQSQTDKAFIALQSILDKGDKKLDPIVSEIVKKLQKRKYIQEKILKKSISFDEEIQYYSDINTKLLQIIYILTSKFNPDRDSLLPINILQHFTEYAGLERAIIYNQLLSNHFNENLAKKLIYLKHEQDERKREFLNSTSEESIQIYNKYYQDSIAKELNICREGILNKNLNHNSAKRCFQVSTKHIEALFLIADDILNSYLQEISLTQSKVQYSTYFVLFMSFVSVLFSILFMFIIRNLLKKEDQYMQELLIASYAFDAQEAMAVTDLDGNVIKVNKAFSQITGYSSSEVLGKNINILQSFKHDKTFYKYMWDTLKKSGVWNGEIYNRRKNGEIYPELLSITAIKDSYGKTINYIAQFIDISDIKKAQKLAKFQAEHDFLTGLLNRRSLIRRLQEEFAKAKRHHFQHAFLFIDIDNFKNLNDTYGHEVGDKVIVALSEKLTSIVREGDIVARLSGDEFAIVLLNIGSSEEDAVDGSKKVCQKIFESLKEDLHIQNHSISFGLSVGVKLFPDGEKNINDIVSHADKAMYQAKKTGKNSFVFFDVDIEEKMKSKMLLEEEILQAFENDEFTFFFQAKVDVLTGEIQGAEMLVRWQHPHKGVLFPDYFIGAIEEMGHIHKLSIKALHKACSFIETNQYQKTLAVNISSKELLFQNFEDEVIEIISSYDINPMLIELEITETAIIEEFDIVVEKIKRLQEFGIQFSIDDFGTGYSSIEYLQELPINTLKIDKRFLQDCSNNSNKELIQIMINMAKVLKMKIIAEGVETQKQLQFLQENRCELYQGFYFSKAVDEESFKSLLKKGEEK